MRKRKSLSIDVFGEHRLKAIVAAGNGSTAEAMLQQIVGALERFTEGTAPYDDVTLVVARRT